MLKHVLIALPWLFLSTVAEAVENLTPREWLEKMSVAMKTLNYQGTVAFMKNGQLDTMKYFHVIDHNVEQERLLSLNSPLREVIRVGGKVSCLFKDSQQKVINHHPVDRSFIVDLPQQWNTVDGLYQLRVANQEEVAMQLAQVIVIQPKDDLRYGRKFWISHHQYLPLKVEVYNQDDEKLEEVMFTDLTLSSALPPATAAIPDDKMVVKHIHEQQSEPAENASFELKKVPVGFQPLFFTRSSMHRTDHPVEHLLISDGFSSVSIYREKKQEGVNGLHTVGSVNSYSKTIGDAQLTVLGEVPAKTVETIADGIVLKDANPTP
jgi:sigma-E factor negative regulatory protein RseB